jgi:uncharacterized membrane protein
MSPKTTNRILNILRGGVIACVLAAGMIKLVKGPEGNIAGITSTHMAILWIGLFDIILLIQFAETIKQKKTPAEIACAGGWFIVGAILPIGMIAPHAPMNVFRLFAVCGILSILAAHVMARRGGTTLPLFPNT